jgi:ABC-type multidrug transport system fused ATPase/permease subunit
LIANLLSNLFNMILVALVDFLKSFLVLLTSSGVLTSLLQGETGTFISHVVNYCQLLATALLVLKLTSDGLQTYFLYQSGDPDSDPKGLIISGCTALVMIWGTFPICNFIIKLASQISNDVNNIGNTDATNSICDQITTMGGSGIGYWILAIIMIVLFIIIFFQVGFRYAEIILLIIVEPIFAINVSSQNRQLFSNWFKQFVALALTQTLQLLVINLLVTYMTTVGPSSRTNGQYTVQFIVIEFGFLMMCFKMPAWIKQFTSLQGGGGQGAVSRSLSNASSRATQNTVDNFMKGRFTK